MTAKYIFCDYATGVGTMVLQLLAQSPHSKKVLGLNIPAHWGTGITLNQNYSDGISQTLCENHMMSRSIRLADDETDHLFWIAITFQVTFSSNGKLLVLITSRNCLVLINIRTAS